MANGAGSTADSTGTEPPRPPLLRRMVRSRTARAATAAGVVGALLGAGAVAWQTDTLPLLGSEPEPERAPCWDSLGESTMSDLFGDRRTETEEQALRPDPRKRTYAYGQCRVSSYRNGGLSTQITVRVHELDGLRGHDGRQWPEAFLSGGMVALGHRLPGMVSPTRAWLALPESCTGVVDDDSSATVVDVAMGMPRLEYSGESDTRDRDALAGAVVETANGVIRELGCSGSYEAPGELPGIPDWEKTTADTMCGIKGFYLPGRYRKGLENTRTGGDGGPARICEAAGVYPAADLRLTTVVDPGLTGIFSRDVFKGGQRIKGTTGDGSFNETRGVYRATCQTGPVIFMMELKDGVDRDRHGFIGELMPAYVAAEAERIGCGPQKVTPAGP